jgi:Cu+-exporting ATPase
MSNFNHYSCGKIVFLKNKAIQMKNTLAFILLSTSLSIIACNNPTSPKVVTVETTQNMKADPLPMAEEAFGKLIIEGMTCAIGCAATIEKNLQKTTGVTFANVDFETKTAWVVYDAKHLNMEAISMVVKATGESYSVTKMERLNSIK